MSNYATLKSAIQQVIKTNGDNEITGALLQRSLLSMINSLGVGYQFVGIATPSTNPGTPDQKVFYIASTAGTYSNFAGIVLAAGEIALLKYDGNWAKDSLGAASLEKVNNLERRVESVESPVYGTEKAFSLTGDGQSIPFPFYAGFKYTIFNDGTIGINFSTRATPDGATVDGLFHIEPGNSHTFVASNDASYLRMNAGTTGRISVETFDDKINDLEERVESNESSIDSITTDVASLTVSGQETVLETSPLTSVAYPFYKGHIYKISMKSSATRVGAIQLRTRTLPDSGDVDSLGAIPLGATSVVTVSGNANYLRIGAADPVGQTLTIKITDISSSDYVRRTVESNMLGWNDTNFLFTAADVMPFRFVKNRVYLLINKSSAQINLSTRTTPDGATVDGIWSIPAGSSKYIKTTADASYLRCNVSGFGIIREFINNDELRKDIDLLKYDSLVYENGGIKLADGLEVDVATRIRTKNGIVGKKFIVAPDGLIIYAVIYYNIETGLYESYSEVNGPIALIGRNNCYARLVFCNATNPNAQINYRDFVRYGALSFLGEQQKNINEDTESIVSPLANFDYADSELFSMTEELQGVDFNAIDAIGCHTFMEQIYAKFDALAAQYPEYITKVDAAMEAGIAYPTYANLNGEASGDYEATPTYRMYMYKLTTYNPNANKGVNAKRKVFIAAGLHGWELASQWNTFILASKLCKLANENYFALRACYDFYLVPCVNGYGAYHYTRQNANGVDLNRNFPNPYWTKSGKPWDYGYTGENAASEFETQVIMSLVNSIKPDIGMDHHSYGYAEYDFYMEVNDNKSFRTAYNVLTKWTGKCIASFPQYYGNRFNFRSNITIVDNATYTLNRWMYVYKKAKISTTCEVSHCIGYLNNVIDEATAKDTYMKNDIVALNEFMLRHVLMAFFRLNLV